MNATEALLGDIAGQLLKAAEGDRTIDAAQVKVVGLDVVRAKAGENWPSIKDSIRLKANAFLQSQVDHQDIIIPCGDGFLIVFASTDSADCEARCEDLQRRFEEFFLGEESLRRLRAEVRHAALTPKSLKTFGQPDGRGAGKVLTPRFEKHFGTAFAPIWSTKQQLLLANICSPLRDVGGRWRLGYGLDSAAAGDHDSANFLDLDLSLLNTRMAAIRAAAAEGQAMAIGLSVHWSTLRWRVSRQRYLQALLSSTPDLVRPLVLKVSEIPAGTPQSAVLDAIGPLRRTSIKVWLSFQFNARPAFRFSEMGVWAFGILLPSGNASLKPSAVAALQDIISIWGHARMGDAGRLIIEETSHTSLIEHAINAGADFLTSETHWPALSLPISPTPTSRPQNYPLPRAQAC